MNQKDDYKMARAAAAHEEFNRKMATKHQPAGNVGKAYSDWSARKAPETKPIPQGKVQVTVPEFKAPESLQRNGHKP